MKVNLTKTITKPVGMTLQTTENKKNKTFQHLGLVKEQIKTITKFEINKTDFSLMLGLLFTE